MTARDVTACGRRYPRFSRWVMQSQVPGRVAALGLVATTAASACLPASWGAGALLRPARRHVTQARPVGADDVEFQGAGVKLRGWLFRGPAPRRGTVIYLHGSADNRASGVWIAGHFVERGFDVLAYDGRAHGESEGDACTYGYHEKADLSRAIDILPRNGPVVVFGSSLGAAVALQASPQEPRIAAIVAVAPFSDLRTVATERAPFFATTKDIQGAFTLAEATAGFKVDDVDCARAASSIAVPVLLVHGANDRETPVEHSRRIHGRLSGPKKLLIVPGAGHNDALRPEVWKEIDAWIDDSLSGAPSAAER